jgi:very-short-patch-repair endonuclease
MRREFTPEHRQRISDGGKGRQVSGATRQKISASLMGHEVTEETVAKVRASRVGYRTSEETRAKLRAAMVGRKITDEWKEAMRRGNARPEVKEKKRQALLRRFPLIQGQQANTPIEIRLQEALTQADIRWLSSQRKLHRFVVDLELVDAPIIVEADGALHRLPRGIERDKRRDAALQDAGYVVLHFTGKQIYHEIDACVGAIRDALARVAQEIVGQSELHGDM